MSVFYPAHGEEGPFFEMTEAGQVEPEVEMPDPDLAPPAEEEESGAGEGDESDAEPAKEDAPPADA